MSSRAPASDSLLEVRDAKVHFDGIVALDHLSFEVSRGDLLGLIGPNGAGKTTLFNCLSRFYTPAEGDILFEGQSILGRSPHHIAGLGIARTFQNLALFRSLSVSDNIRLGSHHLGRSDFLSNALRLPWTMREAQGFDSLADELMDFLGLESVRDRNVGELPFGMQKRVELARALAARPKLVLLDEPAGGLNHDEVKELGGLISRLRDERGVTVLLVEHHVDLVASVCDRIVVLDFGRKIAEGTPAEVRRDPGVISAYLGARRR